MAQPGRSGVAGSRSEFHRIADIRAGMSGPVTSSIPFGTSKNQKKESKSSPFNRGIGQLSARSPNGRGVASLKHRNYEFRFCSSSFGLSSLIRRGKELPSTVAAIARPPYLTDASRGRLRDCARQRRAHLDVGGSGATAPRIPNQSLRLASSSWGMPADG